MKRMTSGSASRLTRLPASAMVNRRSTTAASPGRPASLILPALPRYLPTRGLRTPFRPRDREPADLGIGPPGVTASRAHPSTSAMSGSDADRSQAASRRLSWPIPEQFGVDEAAADGQALAPPSFDTKPMRSHTACGPVCCWRPGGAGPLWPTRGDRRRPVAPGTAAERAGGRRRERRRPRGPGRPRRAVTAMGREGRIRAMLGSPAR